MGVLQAGKMRERVTLYSRGAAAPDAMGQAVFAWVEIATVWAELVPLRATEVFAGQQVTAQTIHKFRIRARSGIDTTCRLEWQGVGYDITGVQPLGIAREALELICAQGTKDGR